MTTCDECGGEMITLVNLDQMCRRMWKEGIHRGVLGQFTHEDLERSGDEWSAMNENELASTLEVFELAADRVVCGLVLPHAALYAAKCLLRFGAPMGALTYFEDKSGWSNPVTAEERVVSLRVAAAKIKAALENEMWRDL